MILSAMYLWFAGQGNIEFSPWWLAACAVCDVIILGAVGDLIHGTKTHLIDIDMK